MRSLGLAAALLLLGCSDTPLEGRPCPCVTAWRCCEATNLCVPEADGCASSGRWSRETGVDPEVALNGVGGSSASDVYTVGTKGTIAHSVGDGTWITQLVPGDVRTPGTTLTAVWAGSATDIYAVGNAGTILRSRGEDSWVHEVSGTSKNLNAVWGSGIADVYVVGEDGLILRSAGDGAWLTEGSGTTEQLVGVTGIGADVVYALGASGTVLRRWGGAWSEAWSRAGAGLAVSVCASGPADLHAVGFSSLDSGFILHHGDGDAAWRDALHPAAGLFGIWGNTDEVLAVGAGGRIFRASGPIGWTEQASGIEAPLIAIWGSANGARFAVGQKGAILHQAPPAAAR